MLAPKIKLLPEHDKRQPYPLSWDEQAAPLSRTARHLAEMALFAVNTGCRDAEICNLRWEWEVEVPELGDVGLHHSRLAGEERRRASGRAQPDRHDPSSTRRRGQHATHVFTYEGEPCVTC